MLRWIRKGSTLLSAWEHSSKVLTLEIFRLAQDMLLHTNKAHLNTCLVKISLHMESLHAWKEARENNLSYRCCIQWHFSLLSLCHSYFSYAQESEVGAILHINHEVNTFLWKAAPHVCPASLIYIWTVPQIKTHHTFIYAWVNVKGGEGVVCI